MQGCFQATPRMEGLDILARGAQGIARPGMQYSSARMQAGRTGAYLWHFTASTAPVPVKTSLLLQRRTLQEDFPERSSQGEYPYRLDVSTCPSPWPP